MFNTRLATILFAAAALSSAQPGPPRQSPIIAAVDTDRDGTVSASELSGAARALSTLDKNHDGQLTEDEVRPQFGGGGGGDRGGERRGPQGGGGSDDLLKNLMALDANSDGQLSKAEVPERMQGLFTRGDKDSDGVLSAAELKALAGSQRRPEGEGPPMDPIRAALDTDRDGTISAAEMTAAPAALAKLDRSGDGILSADEVRPMRGGGRGGNPEEMYKHMLEENDANRDGKLAVTEMPERMRQFLGNADANKDGFISKEEMQSMRRPEGRREDR
jgi:Ca2+-binding EF-hand superfamily protein